MKSRIFKIAFILTVLTVVFAFTVTKSPNDMAWYKCTHCCKTQIHSSNNAPWENGCSKNSSGMHNYQFSGHAGNVTWACRSCKAEVSLKQGASPAGSNCCVSGYSCSWYAK
jgi:hypothetical protein